METELNVDNMLSLEEVETLFEPTETINNTVDNKEADVSTKEENPKEGSKENNKETTEVVDVDDLFANKPESVGSDKEAIQGNEDAGTPDKKDGTSPNFYSSIAKALKEEGILPSLDEETYSKVKTPLDFRDLIDLKILEGLDEKQKRIDTAINAGIEAPVIKLYESTIKYLDDIDEESIKDEGDLGENLRKQLIYLDFINRGFSKERAGREVKRSFDSGTEVEDAKEALDSNKEFFKNQYQKIIDDAKVEDDKIELERKELATKLKTSILEDQKIFGDFVVDKGTRQKVFDNISKPVYKDPDTGNLYTAIQKYEMDNRTEFLKNVGLIFTLTDGFKNFDGLVKGKVNKEVKKGLRELENTINNTLTFSDGNLKLANGIDDDPESFIGTNIRLDI